MSLTSEFDNPGSQFSVFMDQELPGIGLFIAQIAPGLPATLARIERGHNQANSWQTIGTAIDYRLHLSFAADAVSRCGAVFRSPAGYGCSRLTAAGRAQHVPKSLGLAAASVPEADYAKSDHCRAPPWTSTPLRALGPQ